MIWFEDMVVETCESVVKLVKIIFHREKDNTWHKY